MGSLAAPEWGATELQPMSLDLSMSPTPKRRIAYERLMVDALNGNQTLFVRDDEVEAAWRWIDSVSARLARRPAAPVLDYPAGSWGPAEAADFLPVTRVGQRPPEAACMSAAGDRVLLADIGGTNARFAAGRHHGDCSRCCIDSVHKYAVADFPSLARCRAPVPRRHRHDARRAACSRSPGASMATMRGSPTIRG